MAVATQVIAERDDLAAAAMRRGSP